MDAFIRYAYKTPVRNPLQKEAEALCASPEGGVWLGQFKGTPLYDSALELLQEELQQEAREIQSRFMSQQLYSTADQIRLRKRLLELEKARQTTVQPTLSPSEQTQVPTGETLAPGAGTQPTILPPEGAPMKKASVEPPAHALEKNALAGADVLQFLKKNPGLVAGAGLGALGGGLAGAQQGGVPGAAVGALGGGAAGGALGLGAQGAIRSGLKANEIMKMHAQKGTAPVGGLGGVLARQATSRMGNLAQEAGLQDLAGKFRAAQQKLHLPSTFAPAVSPPPIPPTGT